MIGYLPDLKTLVRLKQIPELSLQPMAKRILPSKIVAICAIRRCSRITRKIIDAGAARVFLDLAQPVEKLRQDFAAEIVNVLAFGYTGGSEPLAHHAANLRLCMSRQQLGEVTLAGRTSGVDKTSHQCVGVRDHGAFR